MFWLGFRGACIASALLLGAAGVRAGDEAAELSTIRERIEATLRTQDELKSKTDALDLELADIERNSGRLAQAIAQLEGELKASTRRVAELEQERGRLRGTVARHRRSIERHARAAYAAGREDWLKLLLNQEDPSRLARVLAYHSFLNRARASEMQALGREEAAVDRLQNDLRAEMDKRRAGQRQLAEQQAALGVAMQARRQLLLALGQEIRDSDAELERLRQDEDRLEELLKSFQAPPADGAPTPEVPPPIPAKGQRQCPVAGRLLATFGGPKANGRWDGVLIEAAEGTPVRAAAGGKVVFADWMRGYGFLTIIDHGNGIMSLYAFNQSLYKGTGDTVAAGETVAAVGASGGRRESALYFGIREQGRAVDPLPWCRGRQ